MKYGDLYVIPSENVGFERSVFHHDSFTDNSNKFKDLSTEYYSDYHFDFSDSNDSSIQLICDDNLVVKILNSMDMVIFYIPEFITDGQKIWIDNHSQLFLNYSNVKAYELSNLEGVYRVNEIRGSEEISRLFGYKNFLYHKNSSLSGRRH